MSPWLNTLAYSRCISRIAYALITLGFHGVTTAYSKLEYSRVFSLWLSESSLTRVNWVIALGDNVEYVQTILDTLVENIYSLRCILLEFTSCQEKLLIKPSCFLRYAKNYVHWNTREVPHMNCAVMQRADKANGNNIWYNAYLTADNQLCANEVHITASTKQERDTISLDIKGWGGKISLGSISLLLSC